MQKLKIEKTDEGQPHYLYDLSLPLPERRLQRMPFPSAMAVASFLGVTPQRIYHNRKSKHRIWSEAHGRWFAVRIAEKEVSHEL